MCCRGMRGNRAVLCVERACGLRVYRVLRLFGWFAQAQRTRAVRGVDHWRMACARAGTCLVGARAERGATLASGAVAQLGPRRSARDGNAVRNDAGSPAEARTGLASEISCRGAIRTLLYLTQLNQLSPQTVTIAWACLHIHGSIEPRGPDRNAVTSPDSTCATRAYARRAIGAHRAIKNHQLCSSSRPKPRRDELAFAIWEALCILNDESAAFGDHPEATKCRFDSCGLVP